MMKIPPYLKKGDLIGVTCASSKMELYQAEYAAKVLESWGFRVHLGITVGTSFHNFSAPDELRLEELQDMLDDPEIKAILFGRGGYGMICLLDQLNFHKFKKHPKWICGYSDVTALHSHLHQKVGVASLHSLMCSGITRVTEEDAYVQSLRDALEGKRYRYEFESHELNRKGTARGQLVGGNLTLLASLSGSESQIDTKGKILFLEDIGEYRYSVDRLMYNLKRAGYLEDLAGLIIGTFTEAKDTETPFGQTEFEIIENIVKDYDYPVCYNFPVGHQHENYALKIGFHHELKVSNKECYLKELKK
ncbi:muramoyltetrapeptide carboxypeptidase [Chitinophaga skermanii]|uniref:Muramoyltetrapeptide carboxypeptidase n=1 Tax=Chitinophaga skermanii TaxID=331697 RepID=A0A327R2I1_9BACT|nr:LD-carboxypeptidase [Chitinophaga skermanii]RAJ10831.1 muramoyltetrapeptide carboxypeptidase [Chitinophaga skermanii]